jgi:hypothetical protein
MELYLAGTAVTLSIPLADRNGNALTATSVDYRVVKGDGTEVIAKTAVPGFVSGASAVSITVSSVNNAVAAIDPNTVTFAQIDTFTVRESRQVEVFATVGGNVIVLTKSYALEPAESLIPGVNSFLTYAQADLLSMDIPNTAGWDAAFEKDRIAALVESRWRIVQLRFALLNSNMNFGQDNLGFVPEGSFPTPYTGMFMFNGNLSVLTPKQFNALPPRFLAAVRKAQVAQANALLTTDPIAERRADGLVLESIGEVRQMYRQGKPLDLPVCKGALRYLSPFVTFSKKLGRG